MRGKKSGARVQNKAEKVETRLVNRAGFMIRVVEIAAVTVRNGGQRPQKAQEHHGKYGQNC